MYFPCRSITGIRIFMRGGAGNLSTMNRHACIGAYKVKSDYIVKIEVT